MILQRFISNRKEHFKVILRLSNDLDKYNNYFDKTGKNINDETSYNDNCARLFRRPLFSCCSVATSVNQTSTRSRVITHE